MSLDDVFKRYVWTTLQMMKSPLGSSERMEWLRILDDLKEKANALTLTNSNNFDLDWNFQG